MKFKEYLKRGLCLSLACTLLLTGCATNKPASNENTGATGSVTEQPKKDDGVTQISESDSALVASLRDKYGASTADYADDIITIERGEKIEYQLEFDATNKEIDNWTDYFTVYQDAEMQYPMDCFVEYDYDTNKITITPPAFGVAELSTGSESEVDLSDLSGNFIYDDETCDSWGNFGQLYLVQKIDTETGEDLETPRITIVEIDTELDEAPVAQYSCDDDGVATISWTPVEGAKEYVLFFITKFQGEGYDEGFNAYTSAFARTTDTSWSAPTLDFENETLSMNDIFANYITSEDDMVGGIENMNEDFFETMMDYIGVIAVTEDGCSPVSNLCALKTYSKLLPQGWAWNQNSQESQELNSRFCESVSLLPAETNITMCDGSTSRRVIEYDFDNYVLSEDGSTIEIPSKASGTLLSTSYTAVVENPDTLEADLQEIKDRQEKLKNKGGVVDKGLEIIDEALETTDGDAQETEAPEETPEPEVTEQPEETTAPEASETNTDIPVTANSALSEYIALQMLDSKETIDLSLFTESRNTDIVVDAFMEAKYQNPLVMGIYGASYDENSRMLYVKYDDAPEETATKREETKAKAEEIVAQIITEGMTDIEKETAINQYLCDNAVYDDAALENAQKYEFAQVDDEYLDSFTPYGVLVNGVGVCASYSSAFKVLADEAGLESMVVTGYLEGNIPHAWNRVKIDDQWLSVDSTNNDNEVVQNALLNVSDTGVSGVLVEDERYIVDEKLGAYTGTTDDSEFYRINGKYYDTDAIVAKLAEELNANGDAMLRTDYTIDDAQFQEIAQAVADQVGGSIKGYYWLGVIHLTK